MSILVTGAAGFIGMHVTRRLLQDGEEVVGIDNLNDYYDVQLKLDRRAQLDKHENFRFVEIDLADRPAMEQLFEEGRETAVHVDPSFEQRKLFMWTAWEMFLDRPVLGVGAGNYSENYPEFNGRMGSTVSSYENFGRRHFPHSLYLEIASETV